MIDFLIRFAIERRGVVMTVMLALVLLGIWNYQRLPIDAVPDITNVQVQINTQAAGYTPLEVEQRITYPIETAITEPEDGLHAAIVAVPVALDRVVGLALGRQGHVRDDVPVTGEAIQVDGVGARQRWRALRRGGAADDQRRGQERGSAGKLVHASPRGSLSS